MPDTSELQELEYLNFLYKTSLRRPTTKDIDQRNPAAETFPFNSYNLGQETILNRIKTYPIGDTLPVGVSLNYYNDDYTLVNGTNFGGTLGYPSSSFTTLNVVNSTSPQTYPNTNEVLPPNYSQSQNLGTSYSYPEGTVGGYRLAQLAPGGFIRDTTNVRHYHRLILSPVDNLGSTNPIDTTNANLVSRTYAFSAFDRNGENILKNSIPSNISGITNLGTIESPKNVEHYSIYLGTLGYSVRQFYSTSIKTVQNVPSSIDSGNWSFDFRSGILLFNDLPSSGADSANFFRDFPPVLSFFKYTGPIGLQNLANSEIDIGTGGEGSLAGIQTVYNNTAYTVSASTTDILNIDSLINLTSGETCLVSLTIFETGTDSSTAGGYMGKYISSKMKTEVIYSVEHEITNSSNFKGSFETSSGNLKIINLTDSQITLTILIKTLELV